MTLLNIICIFDNSVCFICQEDHKQPLFSVQFNYFVKDEESDTHMFATAGSNRVSTV
jgi:hypothetical protein